MGFDLMFDQQRLVRSMADYSRVVRVLEWKGAKKSS